MKLTAETTEQIKIFDWIRACTDLPAMHIALERKCSPQYGAVLKRMGVIPGISDIFIPRKSGIYSGLWLELKVGKNKPTPAQADFLVQMTKEGYMAVCVYGSEAAIEFIKTFYEID